MSVIEIPGGGVVEAGLGMVGLSAYEVAVANGFVGTKAQWLQSLRIKGDVGDRGEKGWSPLFAIVADGSRRVLQVAGWVGGQGATPAAGQYAGATGLVSAIGDAVDFRGPAGPAVADGDKGDITVTAGGVTWTIDLNAVGLPKLQQVAQKAILRGPASGTGNVIADTVANLLTDLVSAGALRRDATAQITTGYTASTLSLGTASGTVTLDGSQRQKQSITNNGAFTLAAPAADTDIDLIVTNGASAGAITFSGFTVGANTGEPLTTTNGHRFIVSIRRISGVSTYVIKALQ